jgi:hypothetical protein
MRIASCVFFVLVAVTMAASQDTNFSTGPQYLMSYGSPLFLHPIATPSVSWPSPPPNVGASDATSTLSAGAENDTVDTLPQRAQPADFFPTYYGVPRVSEITLRGYGRETPIEQRLPASILDVGTWQIAGQGLRAGSYEVSLVDAAAYWKSHVRHATHAYGNGDIDRLHQGN